MAQSRARNQDLGLGLAGGSPVGADDVPRRRARAEIDSPTAPAAELPSAQGRRLSEAERRALQERRRARLPSAAPPPGLVPEPAPPLAPPRFLAAPPRMPSKPVPRMPRTEERASGTPRGLVAGGAVLLVGLTVLALAGGRLFGSAGDEPPRDTVLAAADATGIPVLVLGTPTSGPVPPLVTVPPATPAAAAFPGGRAPIVCLDPGHGGPDAGFQPILTDAPPDFNESVLVLQHAWDLEARLKLQGYQVVMTRRTDTAVNADGRDVNGDGKTARDVREGTRNYGEIDELQARINVCNDAKADLLVSMHVNGYTTSDPQGPETWYTREREFGDLSYEFASLAYRHLKEQLANIGYELPAVERGVLPDTTANVDNEHTEFEHFIVLGPEVRGHVKPSLMPGAIVETLFISNGYDADFLASPIGRSAIVSAYENAIIEYFQNNPPQG